MISLSELSANCGNVVQKGYSEFENLSGEENSVSEKRNDRTKNE